MANKRTNEEWLKDLRASGPAQEAAAKMPQVKQHLNQCPACRDEYKTLRDLRRLEKEGGMPSLGDLGDLIY